jgi:hypothetical protein
MDTLYLRPDALCHWALNCNHLLLTHLFMQSILPIIFSAQIVILLEI